MPIGNTHEWGQVFPVPGRRYFSVQEMHSALKALCLQPITSSNVSGSARNFRIPGARGTVGFISPLGENFCGNCNRLRLTADGRLRSCLVAPKEVSLRAALQKGEPLEKYFYQAIAGKPLQHDLLLSAPVAPQRGMSQIGG
jgi:GTP 3',8-cyclase